MVSQNIASVDGTAPEGVSHATLAERVEKFDGETSTDEIAAALHDLVAGAAAGQINHGTMAKVLSIVAEKTGLPLNALSEDIRVLRFVRALNQGDDPAMHIAHIILYDRFKYGSLLWHDPDGALWEFDGRKWIEISRDQLIQIVAEECLLDGNLAPFYKARREAVDHMLTMSLRKVGLTV